MNSSPDNDAATVSADEHSSESRDIPAHIRRALMLLRQAHVYARELRRSPWDFAVEISSLREFGLSNSDLRWMACQDLAQHARETTRLGDDHRVFQSTGQLNLSKRSCFVLTRRGVDVASRLVVAPPGTDRSLDMLRVLPEDPRDRPRLEPRWDGDRRELRVAGQLVKRFKLPSPNQEAILTAFEEEGWPTRIDDPLPPSPGCDPKQRLRDTIKSLNRNQKVERLRFQGDGTGEGVLWEAST